MDNVVKLIKKMEELRDNGSFDEDKEIQTMCPRAGGGTPFLCMHCRAFGFLRNIKKMECCNTYPVLLAPDWIELIDLENGNEYVVNKETAEINTLENLANTLNNRINSN